MTTLASFLMAIAGSLAARVMLSLGIGIVSYSAITTVASNVVSKVTSTYNTIDVSILAILNLAGFGQAIGILLAALTARASLVAIKRFRIT